MNKEKDKLFPGNVTNKVINHSTGEVVDDHEAKLASVIKDAGEDLKNFAYGYLNINDPDKK